MTNDLMNLLSDANRLLIFVIIPTVAIPLAGLGMAALQGMLAVREESSQYAARVVALVLVVAIFGSSWSRSVMQLISDGLR